MKEKDFQYALLSGDLLNVECRNGKLYFEAIHGDIHIHTRNIHLCNAHLLYVDL